MRRLLFLLPLLVACSSEPDPLDLGIDDTLSPVPFGTDSDEVKSDNAGRAGMKIATNTSATQVWVAKNKWEDTNTPAAQQAGVAWGASSGLNWDEKYATWVDSLNIVKGTQGYSTFRMTTPWGKTLTSPVLECAETSIFLRATFAAWYNLPFFMESVDSSGRRVYFGHFGIWTKDGKYANTPNFAEAYKDYSNYTAADLATKGWPHDEALRKRIAGGGSDEQPELGAGSHFGAYLDEVHLNKRAGHYIIYLLNYFGSANLADTANTYNLTPDAVRAGDMLLHRWQRSGIGDTKIVKLVEPANGGALSAQLMSGSMPRRQPKVYDEVTSKVFFMETDTGGVGFGGDGVPYWKLGGGLKRWRVTKNIGGFWTNTWMAADESSWIDSTNEQRISGRPERFGSLLGEVPTAQKVVALQQMIADQRAHLMQYPASCAARQRRELAFSQLYALSQRLGKSVAQIDHENRQLSDYVFAELAYAQSKTCCWNSSTPQMAEIIMAKANEEQSGTCRPPTVFRARNGGYQIWKDYAVAHGRGADWKAWSEDEPCNQRDASDDVELAQSATPLCSL